MSIKINTGFDVGSAAPIDSRLVLSKEQMLAVNDNVYPQVYSCVCSDDRQLYIYDKDAEISAETGKFRKAADSAIELTKEEYDQLSDEEKNNGTTYYITDGEIEGGVIARDLTQEEYDLLSDEEKNNDTIYFITDAEGGESDSVELTKEEYDLLSDEEKNNGALYFITDVDDTPYERYDSGVGIAISESDNTISVNDIGNNYIDNSNFRVNSRGNTEYTYVDTSLYTVDRWYIDGGVLTITPLGINLVNTNETSDDLIRLKQDLSYKFSDFSGKTVCFSAKINGQVYSGVVAIPTERPTEGTAVQYISVGVVEFAINLSYSVPKDYFVAYIALRGGCTIDVEWVKLEIGDEQTPYIAPEHTQETIKCLLCDDTGSLVKLSRSKVLWSTDTYLSTGIITLSSDAAEYDELEIFTYYNSNMDQSYSVKWKNGTHTQISVVTQNNTNIQIVVRPFRCSEDKLSITIDDAYSMTNGGSATTVTTNFLPYKVVGHKYI